MPKETELLTPAEVTDHFPIIAKRFTEREIGYLAMLNLIPSKKIKRKTRVKPVDILRLMSCIG